MDIILFTLLLVCMVTKSILANTNDKIKHPLGTPVNEHGVEPTILIDSVTKGDETVSVAVSDEIESCLKSCRLNTCAPALDTDFRGCNQMFECQHACMIRQHGVNETECKTLCDRDQSSGCAPVVNGLAFNLCRDCNRDGCPTQKPPVPECELGCSSYEVGKIDVSSQEEKLTSGNVVTVIATWSTESAVSFDVRFIKLQSDCNIVHFSLTNGGAAILDVSASPSDGLIFWLQDVTGDQLRMNTTFFSADDASVLTHVEVKRRYTGGGLYRFVAAVNGNEVGSKVSSGSLLQQNVIGYASDPLTDACDAYISNFKLTNFL